MTLIADVAAAPRAEVGRAVRGRPRWPYLAFLVLSVAFGWELFLPDRVLLPTNPTTVAPWVGDASPEAEAVPSNGLMMDTLIFTLPARVYNFEMLRSGQIPFWNPHVFAGYPHLALIQNNALYPLSTVFDLIEPISGMGYSICLHLALAGCLMFAFLRAQSLDDDAAFLGAAAFELNGMFLVRISAPSYVFSGTWLPLMLLGALRIARSGRLRSGWPLLVATTASALGGHPQITSLSLTLAGAFLVLETIALRGGAMLPRLATALFAFAVVVALGVGVAGYQVVPFLELMANSARGGVSLDVYRKAALPFTGLLQAIVPDVFGHPVNLNYWFAERAHLVDGIAAEERGWALNYCGQNLYTGIVPLVLAVVAISRSPRRRDVVFFGAAALASLGILLGTPLLDAAYVLILGFRHSRPDRVIFLYMSSITILTAYGFAALDADRKGTDERWRSRGGALAIAAFAVALVSWPVVPRLLDPAARGDLTTWVADARLRWKFFADPGLAQAAGTAFVLVACVALSLRGLAPRVPRGAALVVWAILLVVPNLLFGWRFNPVQHVPRLGETAIEKALLREASERQARVARILPTLRQALPANVAQLLGIDDIHGASAAGVRGYLDLMDAADPGSVAKNKYFRAFRSPDVARGRLLDLLNVGFVLANVDVAPSYIPLASEDGITLYHNPRALARFFVVEEIERYASPAEGRARLLAWDFDPAARVLVHETEEIIPPVAGDARESSPARVTIEDDDAHAIRLRVATPRGGILVSTEVFYPGWETRIDGQPARTLLVDTAFRGAVIPPGEHEVEMVYVPRSFYLGLAISVVALLAVAFVWRPRRDAARGRAP